MNVLQKLRGIPFDRLFASLLFIVMSVQFVGIEGYDLSFIKVGMMGLCLIVFFVRVPYVSVAIVSGLLYWFVCFCLSIVQSDFRFSTLGYSGLFLIAFFVYYNMVYKGAFSLEQYQRLLRGMILAYAIVLVCQQFLVLLGVRNFPLLNLVGWGYYQWNRLPVLTCEPSHSATILTALFLGYLRCIEIKDGFKPSLKVLFSDEHRWATIGYLWLTFTMGSGTGWLGFGIICLYFLQWRTALYLIPLFIGMFFILQASGNEQFQRAWKSVQATFTGDVMAIAKADGSASVRIIPFVNTITDLDLLEKASWIGEGTVTIEERDNGWRDFTRKIATVEQYGLIGFIFSLIFIYSCVIYRVMSLESLCFVLLLIMTIANAYVTWSMFYVFATIRYFQVQQEKGNLIGNSDRFCC